MSRSKKWSAPLLVLGVLLLGCSAPPRRPCSRVLQGFAVTLHSRTVNVASTGSVSLVASCSSPCRIEVYDAANPAAGILCGQNSSPPGQAVGRHRTECTVNVEAAGTALGIDVGSGGAPLTYALEIAGAHTASYPDFIVPSGNGS